MIMDIYKWRCVFVTPKHGFLSDVYNMLICVILGARGVKCTWRIFYKCVNRSMSMGYTWERGTCKNGGAYKQI